MCSRKPRRNANIKLHLSHPYSKSTTLISTPLKAMQILSPQSIPHPKIIYIAPNQPIYPPSTPPPLKTMLRLINIIPQNLHLYLLQIIPIRLRRIRRPIRLIAPETPPPGIALRPAAAPPAAAADSDKEQDHDHAAPDCDADDGSFGEDYFRGAGFDA